MNRLDPAKTDESCMRLALRQAVAAGERGEVPVGAVIWYQSAVIARAGNQVEMLKDATAHAEMIALTQAAGHVGDWRLTEATLYVTKEPCAMCAGAMVNARLGRLVFGCPDPRMGGAGGALDITAFPGMLHRVQVESGLLEDECRDVLQMFFRQRRLAQKEDKRRGEASE